ncbi:MAG: hypothetical protein GC149_14225 [Gammaproteobacteria bacterium]|nr:hypothetical protein [Gammaproteobacteria bacterium]
MPVRSVARAAACLLAVFLVSPFACAQSDIEKRLDRLEQQVQQLTETLKSHGLLEPGVSSQPAVKPPPPATVQHGGYADIRYYISESALDATPPDVSPLASGRIALGEQIDLQAKSYRADSGGMFSAYRDPSRYRAAGLWLQAQLTITQPGEHRFAIVTQPAREGGSAVTTTETVKLWLNDRKLFDINSTSKWRTWSASIDLVPGVYRVRLWFNSVSPGFGPTPVDSSIRLRLQRPGDATLIPLQDLLTSPDKPDA